MAYRSVNKMSSRPFNF